MNRRYETSGQAPLHIAASNGSINVIEALIAAGARLEVMSLLDHRITRKKLCQENHDHLVSDQETDCVRQTALHYSLATSRSTEAIEALLR